MFNWEYIKSKFYFYKFNPHAIPGVSKLICRMGRHDYEACAILGPRYVKLKCFYCGKEKGSSFSS